MNTLTEKSPQAKNLIARFRGVFPAIPTPVTEEDEIDCPALRRLVNYLLDGGVHGIWALGTGGEFTSLTREQRRLTLDTIVEEVEGRVPVLANISSCCIEEVEAHAQLVAEAGADGAFMIAPYFYHYCSEDICRYFERAASASPVPLVVYHNSHNSGIPLSVEMIESLSKHENIIGIKDSGCDFAFHQALLSAFDGRDDFVVFQGDDTTMAASFLLGTAGAVAALPVIAPRLIVQLFEAGQMGDVATAHQLQRQGMDLFKIYYEVTGEMNDSSFLASQKAALELLGLCTRRPVAPAAPLDPSFLPGIREILSRHELPIQSSDSA